jgi:hypothetical protein
VTAHRAYIDDPVVPVIVLVMTAHESK